VIVEICKEKITGLKEKGRIEAGGIGLRAGSEKRRCDRSKE